jgi:hypothetical protein
MISTTFVWPGIFENYCSSSKPKLFLILHSSEFIGGSIP